MELTTNNLTMSSIDFLNNIINPARIENGESEVRNNVFIARVIDECDGLLTYTNVVRGNEVTIANLNQDQMMLVGMRESKAVRKSVLKKLKDIPTKEEDPVLTLAHKVIEQAKQLEMQAPKVEFHDTVVQTNQTYKYQEAGKKIQQRPNKFVEWLRENNYIDKTNNPYQRYIDQGLFKFNSGVSDYGHAYTQGRITAKGLSYFASKLINIKL